MTRRVQENREAQRVAQEQAMKAQKKQASTAKNEKFSKMVAQKKAETGDGNKAKQQGAQKAVAKRSSANAALLARQGIQANSFSSILQKQGDKNVGQGKEKQGLRGEDMKESKQSVKENAKADRKELATNDKLAAISRDDKNGGEGGGAGAGSEGDGQNFMGQASGTAVSETQATTAQAAQGAAAPQIPQAILQEIVKRLMVGVNAEGIGQVHIQFNEGVLGGASLTLSAKDGKIKAQFQTKDRMMGNLIKSSEGALARALAHKGLTLERLDVRTA